MEDLDPVVSTVTDYNVALIIDGDATWELELTFRGALRSKSGQTPAVDIEDLNSVVVVVTDDNSVGVTDSDVMGMFQLSWSAAYSTKLADKSAIRLEYLDSMIFLVTDIDEAQTVCSYTPRVVEATICSALAPECP